MAQAAPQAASLDQLGVPQELRDRIKLMWLLTALLGLTSWILFMFLVKVDGQENNQWFQYQAKQNLYAGLIWWLGSWLCGIGTLIGFVFGIMGFLAIGKSQDFECPLVGKYCK